LQVLEKNDRTYNYSGEKSIMERISRRKFWLLLILLSGAAAVWLGKTWLFVESDCPRMQDFLLYVFTGIGTLIGLFYVLLTRNDALLSKLISVGGVLAGILVVTSIAATIFNGMPQVKSVYCPGRCEDAISLARDMRQKGSLEAAEEAARTCLSDISKNPLLQECEDDCARELVLTLYEKAGDTIDVVPTLSEENKAALCDSAEANLNEAHDLVNQYKLENPSLSSIEDRLRLLTAACAVTPPLPSPTPATKLEILRAEENIESAWARIDIRVWENGQFLPELPSGEFSVTAEGTSIPFELEEHKADDPICLITVVDNSGSIYSGIDYVREAIRKVNDFRKPDDQLGMVLFSSQDQILVKQSPSSAPLNPSVVDGTGRLTALWDAILEGLNTAQSCTSDSRYLLVLTDGRDNDSRRLEGDDITKSRAIAQQAAGQGVDICTLGVTDQIDEESLRQVSTGCGFYYAAKFEDIANKLQELFGYVRDFYRITLSGSIPANVHIIVRNSGEVEVEFEQK